jgi:hypothetical protein
VDDFDAPFGRMRMSHLIADSEAELHAMADQIGVARRWYQGDHYDVCKSKRELAISCGAVPITTRQLGEWRMIRRRAGLWPFEAKG